MTGALDGVRILDLTNVISGPMATCLMADQGADVIKVEAPGMGDLCRVLGPARGGLTALFIAANRNKRSIALDLKSETGRAVLRDLCGWADLLVQNFRPGAMERLGFGQEAVRALNPRLIYVSISGFGQSGPYADRRVYDPVIQATSGMAASQTNPATREPELIRTLVCDKVTALTAAQAMTAALFARARDPEGRGQHVELSMLDAAVSFLWPEGMYNHTFLSDDVPKAPEFGDFYRLRALEGGFVTISAVAPDEFVGLCRALDLPDLPTDPRFATPQARMANVLAFQEIVEPRMNALSADALVARLAAEDVPAAKVNGREDLPRDPQIVHNGTIIELDHPTAGPIRQARHPATFTETPASVRRPAPLLGEHSEEVLRDLGYGEERVRALVAGKVVVPPAPARR